MKEVDKDDLLRDQDLFDTCVKDAINLGRKWMRATEDPNTPLKEEWALALLLFKERVNL